MCLSYRSIAEQYACSADSIQGAAHLLSFSGQSEFVQCKLRDCSKETKCYRRSGELLLRQFACFWTNPFICIVLLPQRSQEVERKVSCVWFCSATDGWKGHVGFDLCWRAALDRCGGKKRGSECLTRRNLRSGLLEWKQGKKHELKHYLLQFLCSSFKQKIPPFYRKFCEGFLQGFLERQHLHNECWLRDSWFIFP